jgi:hypothetical protein
MLLASEEAKDEHPPEKSRPEALAFDLTQCAHCGHAL